MKKVKKAGKIQDDWTLCGDVLDLELHPRRGYNRCYTPRCKENPNTDTIELQLRLVLLSVYRSEWLQAIALRGTRIANSIDCVSHRGDIGSVETYVPQG